MSVQKDADLLCAGHVSIETAELLGTREQCVLNVFCRVDRKTVIVFRSESGSFCSIEVAFRVMDLGVRAEPIVSRLSSHVKGQVHFPFSSILICVHWLGLNRIFLSIRTIFRVGSQLLGFLLTQDCDDPMRQGD
ncbi:hypothetical protein WDZ92_27875 [Nostoc sp. NIES-2111]